MGDWLIRTFVKDEGRPSSPAARMSVGNLSSISCIVLNLLLSLTKGFVGMTLGSVSVVADAVNNLSDASSNLVSLIGFRLAGRPADEEHPYGHGRIEYLAGMVVSTLIVAVGLQLGRSSVERIVSPEAPAFDLAAILALLLSIAVKLWMSRFNLRLSKLIGSVALEATAADSRNDVLTSSAVLAAGLVSRYTGLDLDGWAGLAVAAFIIVSGIGLIHDTIDPLLGRTPSPELVCRVHERILSYPGVLGTHDLLIHDYGPGRQFASAHVEMAADATVRETHKVLDAIERDLLTDEHLRTILHCDPIETHRGDEDLRNWLAERLAELDRELEIHDVSVTRDRGLIRVSLDCAKPPQLEVSDDDLRELVESLVRLRVPGAECSLTIDSGFVSPES
ncbi:cation diffusion facilitator family transporter [Olsenella urininfantis]|uniref:cation diffusion facilitator family transporter n=1 Tax=Olsenella urininfantis TaxID=1871033 RepID=UPI000984B64C|nr:cation diffusion facilitator family transporter [Olsenella urininfantis]